MTATVAQIGYGSTITVGGTAVPEVTNITVPSVEQEMVDATNLGSPGRYKEYVAGLIEPGTFGFEANYVKATFGTLLGYVGAGVKAVVITFNDTSSVSFNAFVTKVENEINNELHKYKVDCKVSGAVTFTAGT